MNPVLIMRIARSILFLVVLTGLLPSIPVGFLAYATHQLAFVVEEGEWIVAIRALRYLRLPRMARWLRIARPALRAARVVGFAMRASDRLVRQLTPLLNRDLLLFERGAIRVQEPIHRTRLSALRERLYYRAAEQLDDLSQTDIVRITGIDRSTLADIVRRLVQRGYLQRKRTRTDAPSTVCDAYVGPHVSIGRP